MLTQKCNVPCIFSDINRLENTTVSVDDLTYRVRNLDVHNVFQVVSRFTWYPFLWWNNLWTQKASNHQ